MRSAFALIALLCCGALSSCLQPSSPASQADAGLPADAGASNPVDAATLPADGGGRLLPDTGTAPDAATPSKEWLLTAQPAMVPLNVRFSAQPGKNMLNIAMSNSVPISANQQLVQSWASLELEHRDVEPFVASDDLRRVLAIVGELHADRVRVIDDVRPAIASATSFGM